MKQITSLLFTFVITNIFAQTAHKKELEIICEESKIAISENKFDSIIKKTCDVKNYKFISEGNPDYKGRYSYSYKLLIKKNENYIQIANSAAFKEIKNLEKIINDKAEKEFLSMKEANQECLGEVNYKNCSFDNMGISFDQFNDVKFDINLNLPSNCKSGNNIIVAFNSSLLILYLK